MEKLSDMMELKLSVLQDKVITQDNELYIRMLYIERKEDGSGYERGDSRPGYDDEVVNQFFAATGRQLLPDSECT